MSSYLIYNYVIEEVARQGHNTAAPAGIQRVGWMLSAWAYAIRRARTGPPDLAHVRHLGATIEPYRNSAGWRTAGVRVGPHFAPAPELVPGLLEDLFRTRDHLSPLEFYKAFELIHPFLDGNGRTGKILLNWAAGTLEHPTFPPNDLFGEPIVNP